MAQPARRRLVFRDHVKDLANGIQQVKVYEPATATVRRLRFKSALSSLVDQASADAVPRIVTTDFDEVVSIQAKSAS